MATADGTTELTIPAGGGVVTATRITEVPLWVVSRPGLLVLVTRVSIVAANGVWTVGRLELGDLVLGEVEVDRCDGIGQVFWFRGAHDGCGDAGFGLQPGEGDLSGRRAPGFGDRLDDVDDV